MCVRISTLCSNRRMAEVIDALDFSDLFLAVQPKKRRAPADHESEGAREAPRSSSGASVEVPCLVLQHFASTPQLLFGEVATRSSSTRTLLVRNEAAKVQRLEVRGIEPRDALRVYPMTMELGAHAEREVTVTWAPTVAGTLQKRLEMRWNGADVLHVQLRGACTRARAAGSSSTKRPVGKLASFPGVTASSPREPLSPSSANSAALRSRTRPDEGGRAPRAFGTRPVSSVQETSKACAASPRGDSSVCDLPQSQEAWAISPPAAKAIAAPAAKAASTLHALSQEAPRAASKEAWAIYPPTAKVIATQPTPKPAAPLAPKSSTARGSLAASSTVTVSAHKEVGARAREQVAAPAEPKAHPGRKLQLRKPLLSKDIDSCGAGSFYDSAWREKREIGYAEWINFMMSDPSLQATSPASIDAGERQRLSLRQLEQHRNDAQLRRRAVLLMRGDKLRPLLSKVEQGVDSGLLCIRPKINLVADGVNNGGWEEKGAGLGRSGGGCMGWGGGCGEDTVGGLLHIPTSPSYSPSHPTTVGLRVNLLNLLGCYNPLWLRFALEAVTTEIAPLGSSHDDSNALRRFMGEP